MATSPGVPGTANLVAAGTTTITATFNPATVGNSGSSVSGSTQLTVSSTCPDPGTCPSNYLWNYNTCSCVKVSPIILDINGKGFFLTDAQNGVLFDPGTGHPVQMAWTAKGANNAFLALPGPNGVVHSGKDLFGNLTPQPASENPNGFAALAVYDLPENGGNGDGVIDSRDLVFASLRLWIDANHDGISTPDELYTLPSLGVNSISLKYKEADRTDQYGNVFRFRSAVNPDDPDASRVDRKAFDVFFVTLGSPTTKNILPSLSPAGQKCAVPVPGKGGVLSSASK